jgi:CheY-like chemotaxis protein
MIDGVKTILLVEDNPDDVELTIHALKRNNIVNPIEIVRDGQAAVDYLFHSGKYATSAHEVPCVILLDLKLPKLDGIDVLRKIRSEESLKHTPVVVLTSSKEEKDLIDSYDLGVNSYIRKPVDFDQFVDTVRYIGYYWLLLNQPPAARQGTEPAVNPSTVGQPAP